MCVPSLLILSCPSSQVPHAVSPVHVPLPPQAVPPSVPPSHHLWPLRPGPQTRLPLHPLRPEEVARYPHTSPGFPQRSPEVSPEPDPALPGQTARPAEEAPAGGGVRRHPPHATCCAKYCAGTDGRERSEGEGGRADCVVRGEVRHVHIVLYATKN